MVPYSNPSTNGTGQVQVRKKHLLQRNQALESFQDNGMELGQTVQKGNQHRDKQRNRQTDNQAYRELGVEGRRRETKHF